MGKAKKPKSPGGLDEACPSCGRTHVGGGDLEDGSWWIDKAVFGSLSCFQTHQECKGCGHKWDFQTHPVTKRITDELERAKKTSLDGSVRIETVLAFIRGEIPSIDT